MWQRLKPVLGSWPVAVGGLIVLVALVLHVVAFNAPGSMPGRLLERLDTLVYDWRMGLLTPSRPAATPIVIVDIDERTIKQEGWPWGRDKFASLVDELSRQGAVLVGFDVVFSEPQENPVNRLLASGKLSAGARQELEGVQGDFDNDARFARSLRQNVVLGYMLHNNRGIAVGALPPAFFLADPADAERLTITMMPDYTANLPGLMQQASSAGFFTTLPDSDGAIRRTPLLLRRGNAVYTALSLEMAKVYLKAPYIKMQTVSNGGQLRVESLQVGDRLVRTDDAGLALIPYKGRAQSYPYVPATDVLHGQVPAHLLKGAIVFVGTSALGLADLRTTPLQTGYPGVEVHANLLDTILQSDGKHDFFYYHPDWEPGATFVLLLISGLLLAVLLPRLGPGSMLLLSAGWIAALVLGNFALWKQAHLELPLAILLLTALALAGFNIAYGFLRVNSQKREVQAMFGQYVPPAHVERMLANPDSISLEGEQREMTVLFSDIRSFTTISEKLSAAELKSLLNRFFTPITRIIFDNNGTIDKYVGDMVMAFWNAPLSDAEHAEHAIAAALAMLQQVEALKEEFAADGLPEVNIGVGINTGPMNVGDMGSSYRRAYTVLGDAVNLGSRLESVTKFYGVKLLVGENTQAQAPAYLYRLVDKIIVKGKREPIRVYEPVCRLDEASDSRKARVAKYNDAIGYYFAQQWEMAEQYLRELSAQDPERKLYKLHLARIAELKQARLPVDWLGVYEHQEK